MITNPAWLPSPTGPPVILQSPGLARAPSMLARAEKTSVGPSSNRGTCYCGAREEKDTCFSTGRSVVHDVFIV